MDEWAKQNFGRHHILGIVVLVVLVLFGWLYYDHNRNKPIYNDTSVILDTIEVRISDVEQRIDSMSARLEQTQKTLTDLGGRIESSTNLAKEIGNGIGDAEKRLDSAIQRSGRIANLIEEIERTNK